MPNIKPRISVTTFVGTGSCEAEHYYARVYVARDCHGRKITHDAERAVGAAEAAFLNKKDGGRRSYKKGDLTNRFLTEQDALDAALDIARRIWGEGKQIILGQEFMGEDTTITL